MNAPRLVALIRAGAHFERGLLMDRLDHSAGWPSPRPDNTAANDVGLGGEGNANKQRI